MDADEAESVLQSAPFHDFLGLSFDEYGDGRVVIDAPYREELLVNAERELVHGGVLAALLDIAGHYAVLSRVGARVPTADFRVDYLRPVGPRPIAAEAEVVRAGSNIAVADAELRQEYEGEMQTVAVGRGSYGVSHVERD